MGFFATLLGQAAAATRNPNDSRWWGTEGPATAAGVRITPETALCISTAYACQRLLAETIASLPLVTYRRLSDGGRERAPNHPLYQVLHDQPNRDQTAFEFVETLTDWAVARGNGYARIVPGPRGAVDQLEPLHPDRVTVERIPGGKRYKVQREDGSPEYLPDEDVLHLRGMSLGGLTGLSVISYARESLGLALAAESYGARLFSQDAKPGGILTTEKTLSAEAAAKLRAQWQGLHAGLGNAHKVAVLQEGMKWQQVGMTSEDAQFLQTREFQAEDICRWYRVPPHMVGLTSKTTSWGSGMEQLSLGFVRYTLLPWLTRWQQVVSRDLIIATDSYFAEFLVEGLLRGELKARYDAYAIARNWGWLSVNDVRRLENMNPIDGGDVYLQPLNMTQGGAPVAPGFEEDTGA